MTDRTAKTIGDILRSLIFAGVVLYMLWSDDVTSGERLLAVLVWGLYTTIAEVLREVTK
jgi:hypothetical protein